MNLIIAIIRESKLDQVRQVLIDAAQLCTAQKSEIERTPVYFEKNKRLSTVGSRVGVNSFSSVKKCRTDAFLMPVWILNR